MKLRWVRGPWDDYMNALEGCLAERRGVDVALLLAGLVAGWFVYVPLHELMHAFGCLAAGGAVTRLEIDALYGAAFLQRIFPWVAVGSEYAGQLTGFDTRGSDLIYLATDFAPFLLTVLAGVPLLRRVPDLRLPGAGRSFVFGAVLPVAFAPFLSWTGDFYEMGSILVSRLFAWCSPGFTVARWRSDDVLALAGGLFGGGGTGTPVDAAGIILGMMVGLFLALATYALGRALSGRRTLVRR